MSMSAAPEVRPPEKSAESRLSRAARSTTVDLGQTLTRLKDAQLRDGPPSLKERRRRLEKLERAVVAHQEVIATAMREDIGNKARLEALMSEVYLVVSGGAAIGAGLGSCSVLPEFSPVVDRFTALVRPAQTCPVATA